MFQKFCLSNENSSWLFSTLFFIETLPRRLSNVNITLFEKENYFENLSRIFILYYSNIFFPYIHFSPQDFHETIHTLIRDSLSKSKSGSMRMAELISLTNKEIKISQINNNWLIRGKNRKIQSRPIRESINANVRVITQFRSLYAFGAFKIVAFKIHLRMFFAMVEISHATAWGTWRKILKWAEHETRHRVASLPAMPSYTCYLNPHGSLVSRRRDLVKATQPIPAWKLPCKSRPF